MIYKKGKQHINTPLPLFYNILFQSRYNPYGAQNEMYHSGMKWKHA